MTCPHLSGESPPAGYGIALTTSTLVSALTPNLGLPIVLDLALDARVLLFSVVLVLIATMASGLPAALQGTRPTVPRTSGF